MAEKERLASAQVEEFVSVAHTELDRVKAMLREEPSLVNACWDWGNGDWETALGAASHMGNRAIAEHLLNNGARMDMFAAAMLGKQRILEAALRDNAKLVLVPGPHGIPLIQHAIAGGQDAVVELLQSYGA